MPWRGVRVLSSARNGIVLTNAHVVDGADEVDGQAEPTDANSPPKVLRRPTKTDRHCGAERSPRADLPLPLRIGGSEKRPRSAEWVGCHRPAVRPRETR